MKLDASTMTEKELQTAIVELAELRGWRNYHTHDSRRSTAGFPDLCLVRGRRLIFAELKSAAGQVSPVQRDWLQALDRTAAEVFLWKPEDWPVEIAAALL